eukprot:tig00000630_g2732.t1
MVLAIGLVIAAVALAPCAEASSASAPPAPAAVGNELLRLDCGARLHAFPTGFMNASLDLSRLLKGSGTAELFTSAPAAAPQCVFRCGRGPGPTGPGRAEKLKDRFKCMMEREQAGSSSQLTDSDWATGWGFGPQAVVNVFRAVARKGFAILPEAARKAMRKTYMGLPFFWNAFYNANPSPQAWLPDTCSGNGPCFMTIDARATVGAVFKVAYELCPATSLPFISIGCEGSMCSHFLRPCSSDADCRASASDTGSVCLNVFESPTQKQVFTFLKGLGMYDGDDAEGLVAGVMRDLLNYYRSLHGLAPTEARPSPPALLAQARPSRDPRPGRPSRTRPASSLPVPRLGITATANAELLYRNSTLFSPSFKTPYFSLESVQWPIYQYLAKDIMGCVAPLDTTGVTVCSQVSSWDGKLASGESAVSEARKQGRDIAYSGIRVVMDKKEPVTKLLAFDCEGGIHVGLMNFGVSARLPIARPAAAWLGEYVKGLQTARYAARSVSLSPGQLVYYLPWSAGYLLSTFTNAAGKPPKPALTSYYASENATLFDVRTTDCSLDAIAEKGYCLARIAKFLPKDLKAEAGLAQCHGEPSGLAAFELGVSGTGADHFTIHQARCDNRKQLGSSRSLRPLDAAPHAQGCDTSAACGGAGVCENVEAPLEEFLGLPVGFIRLYDLISNALWGNGPLSAPQPGVIPLALDEIKISTGPACLATAECAITVNIAMKYQVTDHYKRVSVGLQNVGVRFKDASDNVIPVTRVECIGTYLSDGYKFNTGIGNCLGNANAGSNTDLKYELRETTQDSWSWSSWNALRSAAEFPAFNDSSVYSDGAFNFVTTVQ